MRIGRAAGSTAVVLGLLTLAAACSDASEDPDVLGAVVEAVDLPAPSAPLEDDVLVFASDRSGGFEIHAAPLTSGEAEQLTDDDRYDSWWPRISPDRTRILFYRTPRGVHDTDYSKASLWMMGADGSGAVQILRPGAHGWRLQGHAEWSPDGRRLVMFGASSPSDAQVYVTDLKARHPRAVTARPGVNIDPSWSPDGAAVAFIGCPDARCTPEQFEVYTTAVDGTGGETRITRDRLRDQDPYFSPDGDEIAWLTQTTEDGGALGAWNIRIADSKGSRPRSLTEDSNVNSLPQWSPDGTTIYFHRLVYRSSKQFKLWRIGVDGSGLEPVFEDQPGVNEFPSL